MSGLWRERAPLLLASKSKIRAILLRGAGLPVEVRPADIDERALEAGLVGEDAAPERVAAALAAAKALDVSARAPGRLVAGADQTLALGRERFSKPVSREDGRGQLMKLSGRTHSLSSGVALARDGVVLWSATARADLTVRPLSDGFVEAYLDAAGEAVLTSVGGYQFEGLGAQLFERVAGDHHAILGLPLLPLLAGLRDLRALAA